MARTVTPYLLYEDVAGALDWLAEPAGEWGATTAGRE